MLSHPGRGDGSARLGGQTAVSGVRTQGTDLRLSCREGQMASKDGSYHVQTSHRPLGCPARAGACSGVSMAAD